MFSFIRGVRVIVLNCFKLKKDERVVLYKEWMRLREKLSFVEYYMLLKIFSQSSKKSKN
jgi:hypothetical protein